MRDDHEGGLLNKFGMRLDTSLLAEKVYDPEGGVVEKLCEIAMVEFFEMKLTKSFSDFCKFVCVQVGEVIEEDHEKVMIEVRGV